ncbi:hypothetical protein SRB5_09660 [Streptomyces sp. RB5]|uniref:Uncharacterized protein n=1 Tax=Streptomyces smaragdinus TaxID=2585196 RepID=A0A7K0CBS9_9ACTN|nr:hypothetical protein [Streptomyces smaragdinus]MQY10853.1 hypothetical protein [Streptomyces smaragdinus]
MGIDYSYEIFVPARNVTRALTELAALAPTINPRPPLTVTLPGGDQVLLPFTSHFESDPVDCSTGGTLDLDTTIMVGVDDDAMREFAEPRHWERAEHGRIPVGYVYLTVRFATAWHPGYASLDFTAATTGMSLAFKRSASFEAVFTGLTAASGGVCCVLDTEEATRQICWLNGEPTRETVPSPRFADYRALAASWPAREP